MAAKLRNREKLPPPAYGRVRSPAALGQLARRERTRQGLTLDQVYSASGLTTRFLSEFERGKPNASLRRVMDALQALGLEIVVLPRGEAERFLGTRSQARTGPTPSDGAAQ